ncbi:hypothetical protein [Helicobacter jaachi]|uniref:hypothetical protein n=1 Tax=Helicobacter jaachi TaxID=1677920 RepID=UPI000AD98397|nr:hypothetical protein [Helicobacter jaachi]
MSNQNNKANTGSAKIQDGVSSPIMTKTPNTKANTPSKPSNSGSKKNSSLKK